MSYIKTNWVDEIPASSPPTYDIEGVASDVEIALHGAPPTSGTPFDATNLNHIEQGIKDTEDLTKYKVAHRQGATGDWGGNAGDTNFDVSAIPSIIQMGCAQVNAGTPKHVIFPTPFAVAPVVIPGAGGSVPWGLMLFVSDLTATGFYLTAWGHDGASTTCYAAHWIAIGPSI